MASYIPVPANFSGYITPQLLQQLGLTQTTTPGGGTGYKDSSGTIYTFNGSAFTPLPSSAGGTSSASAPTTTGTTTSPTSSNTTVSPPTNTGNINISGAWTPDSGTIRGSNQPFGTTIQYNGKTYIVDQSKNPYQQLVDAGVAPKTAFTYQQLGITPPKITQDLTPGMSGPQVSQLQQFLIDQGYSIPDGATGYYGTETQQAVSQWQKENNITSATSQLGYFGPKSIAFLQGGSSAASSAHQEGDTWQQGGQTVTMLPDGSIVPTSDPRAAAVLNGSGSSGTSGSTTANGLTPDMINALHFGGWTDDQIKNASLSDAQNWAMIFEYLQKQVTIQGAAAQVNAESLNQAYTAALNDPTIKGKYADIQAGDVYNFQQQLAALQQSATNTGQQQQLQYLQQIQQLQNQIASGGQEYSGYANQLNNQLNQSESGIIQSTQANLQQQLNQLVSQYQLKYGNQGLYGQPTFNSLFGSSLQPISYTNPMQGSYGYDPTTGLWGPLGQNTNISANLIRGNIQGTNPLAYESDILAKQKDIYQGLGQSSAGTTTG